MGKALKPEKRRFATGVLIEYGLSIAHACRLSGLSRRSWYREDPKQSQLKRDWPVIEALNHLVEAHPRWGFWKCFYRLRNLGYGWNYKRVWRVYKSLNLNMKRRTKKRLEKREKAPLEIPAQVNHTWSFDFMSDALYNGVRFRVLNILDEGVREALDIVVDTSIPAKRVVNVLEQLRVERGAPEVIRVDNGSEMLSSVFQQWCAQHNIKILYIQPGKPNQNAYIERFNRSFREEVLNPHLFERLNQVREMSWVWKQSYNEERPHESLGNIPPSEFRLQLESGQSL